MRLSRSVDLFTALRYSGQVPMWTYIMHRIGGSALFIFFTLYVLDLAGVEFARAVLANWLFQAVILFCALFHVINGLRITILDLRPKLIRQQRQATWVTWAVFLPIYLFALTVVLRNSLGG